VSPRAANHCGPKFAGQVGARRSLHLCATQQASRRKNLTRYQQNTSLGHNKELRRGGSLVPAVTRPIVDNNGSARWNNAALAAASGKTREAWLRRRMQPNPNEAAQPLRPEHAKTTSANRWL
jgi:hypothetical protein